MSFINGIFKRATLFNLREFLLYGSDENRSITESYYERLTKSYAQLKKIVKKYDNMEENSELYSMIMEVLTEHQHVYMEIGIQAGLQLLHQEAE